MVIGSPVPSQVRFIATRKIIEKAELAACGDKFHCLVTYGVKASLPNATYVKFQDRIIDKQVVGVCSLVLDGWSAWYRVPDKVTLAAAYLNDGGAGVIINPFATRMSLIKVWETEHVTRERQTVASAARKRHHERNPSKTYNRFERFVKARQDAVRGKVV